MKCEMCASFILICVLLYSIDTASASVCPRTCVCNSSTKTVSCLNGYLSTLSKLVQNVPDDVQNLIVQGAYFQSILSELQPLHDLRVLKLRQCRIFSVDSVTFKGLNNLEELHLDENMIEEIIPHSFDDLSNLKVLNLSYNALDTLPKDTLRYLTNLRVLQLQNNQLHNFPILNFHESNKSRLEQLDISENRLDFIHPNTFQPLYALSVIKINSNFIKTLHESVFQNNTQLMHVHLYDNPWDCNCGIEWLAEQFNNTENQVYVHSDRVRCSSPHHLHSRQVYSISLDMFQCVEPVINTMPYNVTITRMHDGMIYCNASGYPKPSIVWITPHRVRISHAEHKYWIYPNITGFQPQETHKNYPTYYESKITAHEDGSLEIHQLMKYFSGDYICLAMNPAGTDMTVVRVKILVPIEGIFLTSIWVSFASVGATLILGLIVGSIIYICNRTCCKHDHEKELAEIMEEKLSQSGGSILFDEYDISPPKSPWNWRDFSPRDSPYRSRANYGEDEDSDCENGEQGPSHIKETLDEVKKRLRSGMDRGVERMRNRAHTLRESTSQNVQKIKVKSQIIKENASHSMSTIRQSASQSMSNIKQSSSQYATRLRTGVVMGVEQVKCHVQSMKEMCGTGDMGQTVSCVSITTDIDSQEQREVVRHVTYV